MVAPKRWEIAEVERPEPTRDMMLVRLERAGICGTDKPAFYGIGASYPMGLGQTGHEGLGIVEACASGAYRAGDRVLLWGFDRGLFQEYVLADPAGCVKLPMDLEPEVALMSQLLGTVIHCLYKLGNVINRNALVMGQGAVGQLFNATLRNLGARYIIGVDPLPHRLAVSAGYGRHPYHQSGELRSLRSDIGNHRRRDGGPGGGSRGQGIDVQPLRRPVASERYAGLFRRAEQGERRGDG